MDPSKALQPENPGKVCVCVCMLRVKLLFFGILAGISPSMGAQSFQFTSYSQERHLGRERETKANAQGEMASVLCTLSVFT